jgi:TonB family protein
MQAGEVTFVIQYVSPVRVIPTTFLSNIDYYFTKILGLTALAHLFLILALIFTPKSPTSFDDDLFQNPNRFAKLMLIEQETPPPKKFEASGAKEGAKHKDEEGKFGKPEKEKKDALASVNGAPKIDPNKREKDRKIALSSGIFAALGDGPGSDAASDTFGPGGLGGGINNALGGLRGTAMGDAGGSGGMGARGFGSGGGGSSLGVGGFGGGAGRGNGGTGTVNLSGRGKDTYSVVSGRVDTEGCLTQQQVLRVVSRALSQGRYCYEQEIGRNPNLAGKVVSAFTVGPTGAVIEASVRESTMNNEAVETCLTRVVQRLRFPPCAGGGTAEVTYPWLFTRGGG